MLLSQTDLEHPHRQSALVVLDVDEHLPGVGIGVWPVGLPRPLGRLLALPVDRQSEGNV